MVRTKLDRTTLFALYFSSCCMRQISPSTYLHTKYVWPVYRGYIACYVFKFVMTICSSVKVMLLILITYNYTLLVRCNRTLHQPQSFNPWSDLELTKAPWLALTNELWVIFIELFREWQPGDAEYNNYLGFLLLTWINFNPNINKLSHTQ